MCNRPANVIPSVSVRNSAQCTPHNQHTSYITIPTRDGHRCAIHDGRPYNDAAPRTTERNEEANIRAARIVVHDTLHWWFSRGPGGKASEY